MDIENYNENNNESSLFDDPLLGLRSQDQSNYSSQNLLKDEGEICTPKRRKSITGTRIRTRSKSTVKKKSSSSFTSPVSTNGSSSVSKNEKRKKCRLTSQCKKSPWDKAISKSPALAKFVKSQLEMEKQLEKVELKVVEVPQNDLQFID